MTHNHPPGCCCQGEFTDCPVCPEHGELAPAKECPQCHQPNGRPHTDFCTHAPGRVWPDLGFCSLPDCPETRPHYHRGDDELVWLGRCPVIGSADARCVRPELHDGRHQWAEQP